MINQELIINGQRINLGLNFGVRLNRQLLNPAELNTKDAQFSYSISVPAGGVNDRAFNYSSIEETRDKFNRLYAAEYSVNGIRIFKGNFKLTSVTARAYKGNLYVPAAKTIKDIFGEIKLNQNPELRIPFSDFALSINQYNTAAAIEPQAAIFPYTLYGVLPKVPLDRNANNYSARTLWDASVKLGLTDLLPSLNPLIILRHIFNSQGYNLGGSAFDDERLTRLYMSYKNAADYTPPWNYGYHAKIKLEGSWSSRTNKRNNVTGELERGVNQTYDQTGGLFACDLFDATNTRVNVQIDSGGNVLYKEVNDASGRAWVNCQVRIPTAGFYKVTFDAQIAVDQSENWRTTDPATGVQHVGGRTSNAVNDFNDNHYGMRLVRDRGAADFGISGAKLDGNFYYDNQPQNETFDENNIPKYFPQVDGTNGQINFIDAAMDKNILLGFEFGRHRDASTQYVNPRDSANKWAQLMVAKPAISWNASESNDNPTRLAIKSAGYWKFGRIGNFDNEGDNPNVDIDYSGGTRISGKVLNSNGMPVDPSGGNLDDRIEQYYLSIITGFQTYNPLWNVTDFINLADYTGLEYSGDMEDNPDAAVACFYDQYLQLIGVSEVCEERTYTNEPLVVPAGAMYVRFTEFAATPLSISANGIAEENLILSRFALERFYTYVLEAPVGSNYSGVAYVHNGAQTFPTITVPFVNGVASFDTSMSPLSVFEPKLTIYLKTADYDVDNTLTISRVIAEGSESVVDWEVTDKYKIDLNNAPTNFARRGFYGEAPANNDWYASGKAHAVVWLEAGELLSIASVSSEGRYRRDGMHSTYGWASHSIDFELTVEPFRVDPEWLKVDLRGNGTAVMNWNDPVNFDVDSINLVGFLSADMKTDDFIDNFCKAFNLRLSQTNLNTYALDVKQSKTAVSSRFVNLDKIATVKDRENTPLGLPSIYKIGFTVDIEEQGFVETGDNGGGEYETGAVEESIVEQKSSFSYNWLKNITKVETGGNITIPIAVISKSDVWAATMPYPEAMRKRYTDLAYRFWYFDGWLNTLGATFNFNGSPLTIARVSNEILNVSILNYKNALHTILDNYFTVLINGSSHYTELEGYLTPTMYNQLDGSIMAMFNGDLYFIAELAAYDPTGKNKTNIKLIRKL